MYSPDRLLEESNCPFCIVWPDTHRHTGSFSVVEWGNEGGNDPTRPLAPSKAWDESR